MVESCAYFEASRHILHSLQTAEAASMPFTRYLIEGDSKIVNQPHYLTVNPESAYNLTSLLTEEEKDRQMCTQDDDDSISDGEIVDEVEPKKEILRDECFLANQVTDFRVWPTCDQSGLDASQLKGIQMALTHEVAFIQGPPGTGKTYIGLKIAEALLNNREICNPYRVRSPILVMCLTNHALDQFLEGILKIPYKHAAPHLIRVGSRSQSKELAKLNLVEVRKNVVLPSDVYRDKKRAKLMVKDFSRSKIKTFLSTSNTHMTFSLETLSEYEVMHHKHYSKLFDLAQTHRQLSCVLEMWLGLETSNLIMNEHIDFVISNFKKAQKPRESSHYEEEMPSSQTDKLKNEDENALINVAGDATIEQSKRILDDYHQSDTHVEERKYHLESNFSALKKRCVNFDEERARKILEYGFSLLRMSKKETSKVRNILDLSFDDRWRLYRYWHSKCLKQLCEDCEQDFLEYNERCSRQADTRKRANCCVLETADIIGMTTTGAAKYQHILHHVKPRIVIVEEAAEVLESHIVSALNAGTQHLILIGDHKQLRPKPNEYELAKEYKLDISLFERLISNGFPHTTLECQHRMRPEIAELIKPHIYSHLSNHPSVEDYPNVRGVSTNLFFVKHDYLEEEDHNLLSHSNAHEASYLVSLCRYLLKQYLPEKITILVTYAGQLRTIRKLMPKSDFEGVRVSSVDNFQGEENDIILLSLVRSNSEKKVGFLREENRVCVALSRARQGFYCMGNFDMLRERVPLWEKIMADMEEKGKLGDGLLLHCSNHPKNTFIAKMPEDFQIKSPNGGCLQPCNYHLECGHICTQKCHLTDPEHADYECMERCTRKCLNGHACSLLCYQECQLCEVKITVIMPSCQHEQRIKCHQDPNFVSCKAQCSHKCLRGHPCKKLCYEDCGKCMVEMQKVIRECKHEILLPCHVEPNHSECTKPCEKMLQCNHKCPLKCGEKCSFCVEIVTRELPNCGHQVEIPCHEAHNLSKVSCYKDCKRFLSCGHRCGLKCSEPCQTQCSVIMSKVWPCGHELKRPCHRTAAPQEYPCREKCSKRFSCGHSCTKECGQTCDEKCQCICPHILSCGHKCHGICSQCTTEHIHKLCPFQRQIKRYCGHSFLTSCTGLKDDHPGNKKLTLICCHGSRLIRCSDNVFHTCYKQCRWSCDHFQCTKRCYELCDRLGCNKSCTKRLKCSHQCHGLCGEPCLTVCPQCHPKQFMKKLKFASHFSRGNLYYELPCKHIFSVQYLDEYVHQLSNPESHILVGPIQCPVKECSQVLSCSYRYGDALKQCLSYIQDVNIITSDNHFSNDKILLDCRLRMICSDDLPLNVSHALNVCKIRTHPDMDEKYLMFVFIEAVKIFETLKKNTVINNSIATLKEDVKKFLGAVCRLICELRAKLTCQVADDLKDEFFRLYLHFYILTIKSGITPTHSESQVSISNSSVPGLIASRTSNKLLGNLINSSASLSFELANKSESDCLLNPDLSPDNVHCGDLSQPESLDSDLYALKTSSSTDTLSHHEHSSLDEPDTESRVTASNSSSFTECSSSSARNTDEILVKIPLTSVSTLSIVKPTPSALTDFTSNNKTLDANPAIIAAEEYLKYVPVVTKFQIQTYCEAIERSVSSTSLNYIDILEEMDLFYPVLQKGQWWRCPSGKYFCLKPSPSEDSNEMQCPKCDGLYERVQIVRKEKTPERAGGCSGQQKEFHHPNKERQGHQDEQELYRSTIRQPGPTPNRKKPVHQRDQSTKGDLRHNIDRQRQWQIEHQYGFSRIEDLRQQHSQLRRRQPGNHHGHSNMRHQPEYQLDLSRRSQLEYQHGQPSISQPRKWPSEQQDDQSSKEDLRHQLGRPIRHQHNSVFDRLGDRK